MSSEDDLSPEDLTLASAKESVQVSDAVLQANGLPSMDSLPVAGLYDDGSSSAEHLTLPSAPQLRVVLVDFDRQILDLLVGAPHVFEESVSSARNIADFVANTIWDDIEAKLKLLRVYTPPARETHELCQFLEMLRMHAQNKQLNQSHLDALSERLTLLNTRINQALVSWRGALIKKLIAYNQSDVDVNTMFTALNALNERAPRWEWLLVLNTASRAVYEFNATKKEKSAMTDHKRSVKQETAYFIIERCNQLVIDEFNIVKQMMVENGDEFQLFNALLTLSYKVSLLNYLISMLFAESQFPLETRAMREGIAYYFVESFKLSERAALKTCYNKIMILLSLRFEDDLLNAQKDTFLAMLHWLASLDPSDAHPNTSVESLNYQQACEALPDSTKEKYGAIYAKLVQSYLGLIQQRDPEAIFSALAVTETLKQVIAFIQTRANETESLTARFYASMLYTGTGSQTTEIPGSVLEQPLMQSLISSYVPIIAELLGVVSAVDLTTAPLLKSHSTPCSSSSSGSSERPTLQRHSMPGLNTALSLGQRVPRSQSLLVTSPRMIGKLPALSLAPDSLWSQPSSPREVVSSSLMPDAPTVSGGGLPLTSPRSSPRPMSALSPRFKWPSFEDLATQLSMMTGAFGAVEVLSPLAAPRPPRTPR